MNDQEKQELIRKIELLEWTEEIRTKHPWFRKLLLSKDDVIELVKAR